MPKTAFFLTLLILASLIALRSIGTAAPLTEQKHVAFLDRLKVGQAVSLTDQGSRYEISALPPQFHPLGHTVVEIAPDYVVLRDIGNITDTFIPIYSVRSIRVLRFPNK